MALDFSQAELLSFNSRSEFLGDNHIRFKTTKELTIEGFILNTNLRSVSGAANIWSGISGFELQANNWQNIQIGGQNFGSGIINSLTFSEEPDVIKKKYTANISIYETGSPNNFPAGSFYSGINWTPFCEIESLDESITFDTDYERSDYNHRISVKVLSSNISGSVTSAKAIAANLFTSNNLTGFSGQYNYFNTGFKTTYTESYDLISAECSFNKRIEALATITGNYTIGKIYSFNRDEAGIINISERGEIKALQKPYEPILYTAVQTATGSSYTNCLSVFNIYQETNNYALSAIPLVKGSSMNALEGTLDYEMIFTNDLNESGNFFWNYSHEFSADDRGIIISSENGEIIGRGDKSVNKYNLAVNGYNSISSAIQSRTSTLYSNYRSISKITVSNPSQFVLVNKNESFNDYLGKVSYRHNYSNDPAISSGTFRKTDVTVTEDARVPLTNAVIIPAFAEVEQNRGNLTVGHRRVLVSLQAVKGTTFNQYLTQAKSVASTYNIGNMDEVRYTFNPNKNQFTLEVSFPRYS
jgi:hypothetical protein